MITRYQQLVEIHNRAAASGDPEALRQIPSLLTSWGLRPRADDGTLLWTNLSVPTSVSDAITVGLRYVKRDGSLTEDVFEVASHNPDTVISYYRGTYQSERPEYASTHWFQGAIRSSFTSANTCSLYMK
jgi:hypothetical protein